MKWLLNTPKTEPKPGTLIVFISKKGKLSAGYISQEVLYYDYYDGASDVPVYGIVCHSNNGTAISVDNIFAYCEIKIPKYILEQIKPTPNSPIGLFIKH